MMLDFEVYHDGYDDFESEGHDDGFFECTEGHVHDAYMIVGPTHEGAPCPNDPESPNAYDEDDGDLTTLL
jgi:hypothetical protein